MEILSESRQSDNIYLDIYVCRYTIFVDLGRRPSSNPLDQFILSKY